VDRTLETPDVADPSGLDGGPDGRLTPAAQHEVLTEGCGLFDRSERGKLALAGPEAVEFLNGQVTNELADLRPGEGRYAAFLTHKGKMLGDLRVLALGATTGSSGPEGPVEELLLDTERVSLQALFDMIRRFKLGFEVELHKRTLELALLSLAGPRSGEVVRAAADGELAPPLREHEHTAALIAGRPVRVVAVAHGGLDVFVDLCQVDPEAREAHRMAVLEALVQAGAQPVSTEAAEVLRVERGIPRFGIDLDEGTIPQEAGLNERAVSFTKGCYVGQETVARLHYRGKPNRHLRGLRLSTPIPSGAELHAGEREVGRLGSSVVSPRHGPIALALVRREAGPGDQVSVGPQAAPAEIVSLPFG